MSTGYTGAYLLDNSAILAYTGDEPGSDVIHELLQSAGKGRCQLYISVITLMEACYKAWQREGEESARLLYARLTHLPAKHVEFDQDILWLACEAKATCRLSIADAWILATARRYNATLVHKDPEFEPLHHQVTLLALPYKG